MNLPVPDQVQQVLQGSLRIQDDRKVLLGEDCRKLKIPEIMSCSSSSFEQVEFSPQSLIREDLPVLDQHLPDLLHDDVVVTHQEEERGVRVVEPVQQHL